MSWDSFDEGGWPRFVDDGEAESAAYGLLELGDLGGF